MNRMGVPGETPVDPVKSVIVVSDLHLGGNEDPGTSARFSRFLDRIAQLGTKPAADERSRLLPPQKIILLGDILELWDPRDQDRDNVLLDAIVPFAKLGNLGCELVYVTGNHDEDVGDLLCSREKQGLPDLIPLLGQANLHIFRRSYIPDNNNGLDVGGVRYAFLHGHQFDPEQITNTISSCLDVRFDPVDFLEDLANNNAAKEIPSWVNWTMFFTWVFLLVLNGFAVRLITAVTAIFWLVVLCMFLWGCYLFAVRFRDEISSRIIALVSFIGFVAVASLLVAGIWVPGIYPGLFSAILVLYSLFVAVISLPRLISYGKRSFYNSFKPQDLTIGQMVQEDAKRAFLKRGLRYIRPEKFSLAADVVVFGHTHCADVYFYTIPDRFKNLAHPGTGKHYFLFNTGCWLREGAQGAQGPGVILFDLLGRAKEFLIRKNLVHRRPAPPESPCSHHPDTFMYIDLEGIRRMEWHDDPGHPDGGTFREVSRKSVGEIILRRSPGDS